MTRSIGRDILRRRRIDVGHSFKHLREHPSTRRLLSNDRLLNIRREENELLYYLYTSDVHHLDRYGGISFGLVQDYIPWSYPTDTSNGFLHNPSAIGITTINHPINETNNMLSTEFILRLFNVPAYVEGENVLTMISLFLMYGWAIIPVMYPFIFRFTESSNAYIFLIVINLFNGITCIYKSFFLEIFGMGSPTSSTMSVLTRTVKKIFKIFPNYCPGRGLIDIAYNVS